MVKNRSFYHKVTVQSLREGSQQLILPVVAHRGACLDAPENSLTAFRLVKQRGVHCVELDVSMTKDGVPIIFHDDFVDRVTNGTGRVTDLTFAEIQKLELSSKFIFP
jgi:glycerophosphoryl diester phosphodiesterase